MTIAFITLCLGLVALLAYREQAADRQRAAILAEADRERAELLHQAAQERAAHAEERRELYQRIQAPEIAVSEAVRRERGPYQRRKPIAADDDAAFQARGQSEPETDGG